MSNATSSIGGQLQIDDGNGSYGTVVEVGDVTPPGGIKNDMEDVTTHASLDGFHEFLAVLGMQNDVKVKINWQPNHATHSYSTGLAYLAWKRIKRNMKWFHPAGLAVVVNFTAWVQDFQPSGKVKGALTADVTIKPTGTFTVTST